MRCELSSLGLVTYFHFKRCRIAGNYEGNACACCRLSETSAMGYHLENMYWTSLIWDSKAYVWI